MGRGGLGKQAIDCQDRAGSVVNALLIPFIFSAIRMFESGFASAEDIDRGLVLGAAHPQGPLALADVRDATDDFFGRELASRDGYTDLREIAITSLRGMALTRTFDTREGPTRRHIARLKQLARTTLLS